MSVVLTRLDNLSMGRALYSAVIFSPHQDTWESCYKLSCYHCRYRVLTRLTPFIHFLKKVCYVGITKLSRKFSVVAEVA